MSAWERWLESTEETWHEPPAPLGVYDRLALLIAFVCVLQLVVVAL
jgi:hypothetical protein